MCQAVSCTNCDSKLLNHNSCYLMQTRARKDLCARSQDSIEAIASRLKAASLTTQTHHPVSGKKASVLIALFEAQVLVQAHCQAYAEASNSTGSGRFDGTQFVECINFLDARLKYCRESLVPAGSCTIPSKRKNLAGEVALPGGKRDDTDRDDVHTALREAQEELGITEVEVLGKLKPFLSKHFLSVTPIIGRIPSLHSLQPNPAEVDAVFDVPLRMFLECHPDVYSFRDTKMSFGENISYRLHFFRYGEFTVWGLTAGILIAAAIAALARPPEFQTTTPETREYTDLVYDGQRVIYRD